MRLNKPLYDLKLNMNIDSFLGEIMSVIDCGEEIFRAPPAYIDRIIRDAQKEVNGDIPPHVRKGNNCERDARKGEYDLICIKSLTALNTTGRVASPCKSCLDDHYDQVEWNVQDSIPDLKIVRKGNNCEGDARKVEFDLICIQSLTALNTTGSVTKSNFSE